MENETEGTAGNEVVVDEAGQATDDGKAFADSFREKFNDTANGLHEAFNTEPPAPEEDEDAEPPAPEPVRVFGLTEEEFKSKLSKADEFDRLKSDFEAIKKDYENNRLRVYGQVGTLKTELDGIKKRVPRADAKARVAEHFQELVPLMWSDDDEVPAQSTDNGQAQQQSQQQQQSQLVVDIDREVNEKLAARATEQDVKTLLAVHPDAVEISKTPEWNKWMADNKYEDPSELPKAVALLSEYKKHRESQKKTEEQKDQRREKIKRSVVAAGDGNVQRGGNDADEFKSSFKKSFAKNMRSGFGG